MKLIATIAVQGQVDDESRELALLREEVRGLRSLLMEQGRLGRAED